MIIIPKKISYEVESGYYRAVLREAFIQEKTGIQRGPSVRLVFELKNVNHPRKIFLAGRNYPMKDLAQLGEHLDAWLGDDVHKLMDANGHLSLEKLQTLKGQAADLDITLLSNEGHETAYRLLQRMLPPGTLVSDASLADEQATKEQVLDGVTV